MSMKILHAMTIPLAATAALSAQSGDAKPKTGEAPAAASAAVELGEGAYRYQIGRAHV